MHKTLGIQKCDGRTDRHTDRPTDRHGKVQSRVSATKNHDICTSAEERMNRKMAAICQYLLFRPVFVQQAFSPLHKLIFHHSQTRQIIVASDVPCAQRDDNRRIFSRENRAARKVWPFHINEFKCSLVCTYSFTDFRSVCLNSKQRTYSYLQSKSYPRHDSSIYDTDMQSIPTNGTKFMSYY